MKSDDKPTFHKRDITLRVCHKQRNTLLEKETNKCGKINKKILFKKKKTKTTLETHK